MLRRVPGSAPHRLPALPSRCTGNEHPRIAPHRQQSIPSPSSPGMSLNGLPALTAGADPVWRCDTPVWCRDTPVWPRDIPGWRRGGIAAAAGRHFVPRTGARRNPGAALPLKASPRLKRNNNNREDGDGEGEEDGAGAEPSPPETRGGRGAGGLRVPVGLGEPAGLAGVPGHGSGVLGRRRYVSAVFRPRRSCRKMLQPRSSAGLVTAVRFWGCGRRSRPAPPPLAAASCPSRCGAGTGTPRGSVRRELGSGPLFTSPG